MPMPCQVYPIVDVIVITQSNITFSGFKNNQTRFEGVCACVRACVRAWPS